LTDPDLTYRQLIAANGDGDDDWTMPTCDATQAMAAREYLAERIRASRGDDDDRTTATLAAAGRVPGSSTPKRLR